jgi:HK97 family phage portal protein
MRLRERIGRMFLGAPSPDALEDLLRRAIAANPALAIPSYFGGRPVWNTWSVQKAIEEGYRAHDVVYSCVRRLSTDAASVPWRMMTMTADGPQPAENHRGSKLIAHPNPRFSWQDMIELLTIDLNLGGEGYWLHLVAGQSDEVWRLRPDRVAPRPGEQTVISGYDYKVGERTFSLKPEEVVRFAFFDPGDDYHGLSPLRALARVVDTDNEGIDWNKASLQNRATPAGALIAKSAPTGDQMEDLRDYLSRRAEGPANARKPLVLWGDLTWQQFGLSPQDMDFIEGSKLNARRICNGFGVPPIIAGVVDSTFDNYRLGRRTMWEDTIIPFLSDQRGALNLQLAPLLGGDATFDFDLSQTPAVREAQRERANEAKTYFDMGFSPRAINEHLGLGFAPEDAPETGFISAMLLPVNTPPVPTPVLPPIPKPTQATSRSINLRTEVQRTAHWRRFDRQRQAWERAIAAHVSTRFAQEREQVVAAWDGGNRYLDSVVDAGCPEWEQLLTTAWRAVIGHFGGEVADQLSGRSRALRIAPPLTYFAAWDANIQEFVRRAVGESITQISETTKLAIREQIAEGLDNNESSREIAARIREVFDEADTYRSYLIARTEVGGAANYGAQESARQSGVVETKTWISSRDDRVRDSHAPGTGVDGETVGLDEPYSNGLYQPGDPNGPASEICNCRCVEGYSTGAVGEEE